MTAAIHTLGCKVNRCDAESLALNLTGYGFKFCDFGETADVYIINTCTVTHVSDKKSMQLIRRAKRRNPDAIIAVCGCLAKRDLPDGFAADIVFDARKPEEFIKKLGKFTGLTFQSDKCKQTAPTKRTRSFVKIQDGCEQFCAYCIVPYVRGPSASRKKSEVINEINNLINNGAKEIVLTGIHVSSYNDEGGFTSLLKKVLSLDGLYRLRLSSIDPMAINDDFLEIAGGYDNLCPFFHLSLQSGSDEVLKKMNR